jgi:hypothetical protein
MGRATVEEAGAVTGIPTLDPGEVRDPEWTRHGCLSLSSDQKYVRVDRPDLLAADIRNGTFRADPETERRFAMILFHCQTEHHTTRPNFEQFYQLLVRP